MLNLCGWNVLVDDRALPGELYMYSSTVFIGHTEGLSDMQYYQGFIFYVQKLPSKFTYRVLCSFCSCLTTTFL